MATKYLRSGAGGAATGADWANAYLTIAAALSGMSAGDTLYVSEDHNESNAVQVVITPPGTAASPNKIICVDHTGSVPPVSADLRTTATISTTTNNIISWGNGFADFYGITFSAGSGSSAAGFTFTSVTSDWYFTFDACTFKINTTSTSNTAKIVIGASGSLGMKLLWNNCICQFGATAQGITVQNAQLIWQNTSSALAGSVPTTLFQLPTAAPRAADIRLRGLDLSALGSSNVFNAAAAVFCKVVMENCKLGSSFSLSTGSVVAQGGFQAVIHDCDSGNTNYKYKKIAYDGTIDHETTIVRSGGASDGTTSHSRKMVSSANSQFFSPLVCDLESIWNESTSSVTVTVEVVTDNVTLKDNEAWIDVIYLGTSGFPQSVQATDRAADILASGANQTTSSETWTTTGLTTPVKQKFSVTFTPSSKGPFLIQVSLAKATTTMYVDPKVTVA